MYCFKCGKQIPDESVFCSFCGTKVSGSVPDEPQASSEDVKFSLTIDRKSQPYLINPPVKVIIDEDIRFGVDNGKTETVSVTPGHHHIELKMRVRQKSIDVDVQKDTTIEIGFNRLTGAITADVV